MVAAWIGCIARFEMRERCVWSTYWVGVRAVGLSRVSASASTTIDVVSLVNVGVEGNRSAVHSDGCFILIL
jgi:hypothetical protein